jgi:HD-GYP domain-containing protein (c-di-GMP phosphodiesterase class II)
VDIWDALLYERVYRSAWPEEKVLEYLKNNENPTMMSVATIITAT